MGRAVERRTSGRRAGPPTGRAEPSIVEPSGVSGDAGSVGCGPSVGSGQRRWTPRPTPLPRRLRWEKPARQRPRWWRWRRRPGMWPRLPSRTRRRGSTRRSGRDWPLAARMLFAQPSGALARNLRLGRQSINRRSLHPDGPRSPGTKAEMTSIALRDTPLRRAEYIPPTFKAGASPDPWWTPEWLFEAFCRARDSAPTAGRASGPSCLRHDHKMITD